MDLKVLVAVGWATGTQTPWYSFLSGECRDQDAGNDPYDRRDCRRVLVEYASLTISCVVDVHVTFEILCEVRSPFIDARRASLRICAPYFSLQSVNKLIIQKIIKR